MAEPEMEISASQALFAARLLEAVVHHPGPWYLRWGGVEVLAEKRVTDEGISFVGTFPEICYLEAPTGGLHLLLEDEDGKRVMGIQAIDHEHPGDVEFDVAYEVITRRNRVER